MKQLIAILLCVACLPALAASKKFTVVHRVSGCDYFVVQTDTDYAVLEWFGGHDPDKDDRMVGDLGYGFRTLVYDGSDRTVRVYVEEFGLNRANALDKLTEKCK